MKKILVHGSGHKATSWKKTIEYMKDNKDILCPNLSSILNGKDASYTNLYSAFTEYCNEINGKINLCGLSLGGILALNYALDFPEKVQSLILIGTPYKVPKIMFSIQNIIFRFSVIYRFDYLYHLFSKPSLRLLPLKNYAYFLFIQGEFVPAWKIRTDFKDIRYKHLTHLNVNAKNIDIMRFLAPYFSTTKRKTECSFVKLHSAILMLFVLSFAWLLIT